MNDIKNTDNLEHYIGNDEIPINDTIKESTFDEVTEIFGYEKSGDTIEKELEEFNSLDSTEKETLNKAIDTKSGFDLDDLGETSIRDIENETLDSEEDEEGEEIEQDTIEDYFTSAEFVIFIVELAIVWGTNMYLKSNDLDKISIEEFKKSKREQKALLETWAELLQKHNLKVGVEARLIMNMGSAYGMKLKGIVREQKLRKQIEIEKNKKAIKVVPLSNIKKSEEKKKEFKLNKDVKLPSIEEQQKDVDNKKEELEKLDKRVEKQEKEKKLNPDNKLETIEEMKKRLSLEKKDKKLASDLI